MANVKMIGALRPKLEGFVAQGKALAGLSHSGVKGRLREILAADLVQPFLPPTVSVLTGTVIASSGERQHRTQDDLVIFSREKAPLLLDGEQSIIPIEGVLAQIDVKTRLQRDGVKKAVRAATELRDLAPVGEEAPGGLIFAYGSDISKGSEVHRLLDVLKEIGFTAAPDQATSPIQLMCIADRGTWMLTKNGGREGWWFVPSVEGRHLLAFTSVISNTVYQRISNVPGVGNYLLDVGWLEGPCPECPLVTPKATEAR